MRPSGRFQWAEVQPLFQPPFWSMKAAEFLRRSQGNQLVLLTLSNRLANSPSNATAASPITALNYHHPGGTGASGFPKTPIVRPVSTFLDGPRGTGKGIARFFSLAAAPWFLSDDFVCWLTGDFPKRMSAEGEVD